jgi:hypothetical protein
MLASRVRVMCLRLALRARMAVYSIVVGDWMTDEDRSHGGPPG